MNKLYTSKISTIFIKTINNSSNKAILLTLSKIITLSLSIVTAMILARHFSLTEYGTYSELLTVSSIAVSLLSLGLPSSLNYFLPQNSNLESKQKFIGFYFFIVTSISIIMMIVMGFINSNIANYYNNPSITSFSYFLILIPWTKLIIASRSNMLVAEGYIVKEFLYCVSNGICLTIITIFVIITKRNLGFYLWLYVFIELVFTTLVYFEAFLVSGKKIRIKLAIEDIMKLLKFSIPLGASTAISTISLDLDKLIIGYFLDEKSVALYANAGKELPFSIIATSFTAILLPQIVVLVKLDNKEKAIEKWKNAMEFCYIILIFFSLASIVFAPQIISFLYSEIYLGGVEIFRIYSITLIMRITYWGMFLNAYAKTHEIFYNAIVVLFINLILSIIFFNMFGFLGPALATLTSIVLMSTFQIIRTSKLLDVSCSFLLPWREFLKPTVFTILSSCVMLLLINILKIGTDIRSISITITIGIIWFVLYLKIFSKRLKLLSKD